MSWEQMDSWLTRHLQENPEIERRLMESPLESLDPADQFFRASVLEGWADLIRIKKGDSP